MSQVHSSILPKKILSAIREGRPHTQVSQLLVDSATMDPESVVAQLSSRAEGLTTTEAAARFAEHGPNVLAKDQGPGILKLLLNAVLNPLVILLAVLASISFATGDARAEIMMSVMIVLGVGLRLFQETKANNAAAKLKDMISVTATVIREGKPNDVAISQLIPGNIVILAAGDIGMMP